MVTPPPLQLSHLSRQICQYNQLSSSLLDLFNNCNHCIASHCAKCRTFLFETENYKDLRSTISQQRLDGLALLAIENEAAKQLKDDMQRFFGC